jgi:hypothetical protein
MFALKIFFVFHKELIVFQGMKCSTRVCYCCIFRLQPMYVMHKPKLSMYSNWRVVTKDCHPSGLSPTDGLSAYNSVCHSSGHGIFSIAGHLSTKSGKSQDTPTEAKKPFVDDDQMIVTHSSQWKKVKEETTMPETEKSKTSGDGKVTLRFFFKIFLSIFLWITSCKETKITLSEVYYLSVRWTGARLVAYPFHGCNSPRRSKDKEEACVNFMKVRLRHFEGFFLSFEKSPEP